MAEEIGFENGRNSNFQGLVTLTLSLDPVILPGIPSCITHRPLPIYQISFKLKKLFVDGRTDVRTDIFPPLILLGRLLEVDLIIIIITQQTSTYSRIHCILHKAISKHVIGQRNGSTKTNDHMQATVYC